MRRSITAPIQTMTENTFRSLAFAKNDAGYPVGPQMQARATAKMRARIAALLTNLPRPKPALEDGTPNRFRVKLTRVSPGYTDDDGLSGGTMKAVRDEVAIWCGLDDGHARISFVYDQHGCPRGEYALRIDVEDLEPGVDVVIEQGNLPRVMTRARARGSEEPRPPKNAPAEQQRLVFRESFAVLPWDQDGGDPVLTPLSVEGDPPERIRLRVPATIFASCGSIRFAPGTEATFERALGRVDGKEAWIFSLPEGAADTRTNESRRTR